MSETNRKARAPSGQPAAGCCLTLAVPEGEPIIRPAVRGRWNAPLPEHGGSGGLLRRKGLQVEFGSGTIDQRLGLAEQIGAKQTQDNRRNLTGFWLEKLQLVHRGVKVLLFVCADF